MGYDIYDTEVNMSQAVTTDKIWPTTNVAPLNNNNNFLERASKSAALVLSAGIKRGIIVDNETDAQTAERNGT